MSVKYDLLKPHIGAKVYIERQHIKDAEVARELLRLLDLHTVLVFPKLRLSNEEQLALTDALGERINISRRVAGREDSEEVYEVTLNEGAAIEKEYVLGTWFWHMDGLTVDVAPPKATLLSARRLATDGGQTEFASTKAAYEALPDNEKTSFESMRVVHSVTASLREIMSPEEVDPARRVMQHEHPLVRTDSNGSKSLVIGSTADLIVGKSRAESRAILARLLEWSVQPAFSYRHEWEDGDCVVWDNTSALHRVIPYSENSGRLMNRTTIAGIEAPA
ncbi:alpha-ketoglutarate-dependent taurine dioxygenase [Novosphingobium sp. PhB55]|uniref:TauD/TfdA dioxygenase family protein n=1 Tax=Novosphingobium sp. PhB55 TaxID=2485106 RepID=UPI001066314E|nr:TauD/TfdA family dioxygenase [Novosphingobium sp. PhB55]TDW61526.1 alpha-ketoglutarate-dependent taurine dioxygenase [Novosphingobium sp. PhB55]